MSPMRFPRVAIIKDGEIIEYGYLNKDMPQGDGSYLYEIYGDSATLYILKQNEFFYVGENDEPKWQG
jgi:hypothetical protein